MSKNTATKSATLYRKSEDPKYSKAARQYYARQEAHTCVKCGGQLAEGSNLLCPSHLEYYNSWHAAKRAKIAAAMELLKEQEVKAAAEAAKAAKKAAKSAKKAVVTEPAA